VTARKWNSYDAVAACEGFDGIDHEAKTLISAWQYLIDTGLAWSLQGAFGRQATVMIESGICTAAKPKRRARR
jgi:hypothetical protein